LLFKDEPEFPDPIVGDVALLLEGLEELLFPELLLLNAGSFLYFSERFLESTVALLVP